MDRVKNGISVCIVIGNTWHTDTTVFVLPASNGGPERDREDALDLGALFA